MNELKFDRGWKLIIPFALFPLLIVSAAVGVFYLFGVLAEKHATPEDYLYQMKTSSKYKRWQAAYELSSYLASRKVDHPEILEKQMLDLLASTQEEDIELRHYLIVGLGQIGTEKSVKTLLDFVKTVKDSETQIYVIWALGRMNAKQAAPFITSQLNSDDPGIRKTAAFSLGFVGKTAHLTPLKKLLDDPIRDVRWNAALGLAQLGNASGESEILEMLNRKKLSEWTKNLRDVERDQIQISAANAAAKLKLRSALAPLKELSKSGENSNFRNTISQITRILEL